ncbi:unnamed protein product [Coffea canephora]|uniref:Mitochondrial import inner membrane translocase subunit TIM50 n=1 Tax=Coffea canephora TaxID=49390 RepID=A0A068VEG9_COFCA|nr:unnamed protein product [Coffea canephora]
MPELASTNDSNKKFLILDLNGVLLGSAFTRRTRNRYQNFRAHCFEFLKVCLSCFDVVVWSSKLSMSTQMNELLEQKLLFVWDQSRCTVIETRLREHPDKNVMFKELKHMCEEYKSYNSSNTILVDDSPYKSFLNSVSTPSQLILMLYMCMFSQIRRLDLERDFVRYLKKLADADNVQEFRKQNPFGQSSITEGSEDWNF